MVELVDATDSKSVARKGVLVQVRPGAPSEQAEAIPISIMRHAALCLRDGRLRAIPQGLRRVESALLTSRAGAVYKFKHAFETDV